jgi:hypothetical protein
MSLMSERVILAAGKLALFYVVCVALEMAVLILTLGGGLSRLTIVGQMATWLSIPFAGAFLLLAVARRWGLVAMWIILAGFWGLLTLASGAWGWASNFLQLFLPWSIFALPLWIIGQGGIPSRSPTRLRVGPVRLSMSMVLLVCWAALLVGGKWFARPAGIYVYRPAEVMNMLGWIWGVAPFVLSAFAIRHVWRGTVNAITA